jgi:hypothetical protein
VPDKRVIRPLRGEVRVASRIVDYLSSGLYDSPAACLKELVNNSYDADATEVYLNVKPLARTVTLEDNGSGMTAKVFEEHFQKIADSRKRLDSDLTSQLRRRKIGRIGIGFVAANELCDVMRIESTVAGSDELLDVSVNFGVMRADAAERRGDDGSLVKGDYEGDVLQTDVDRHFTRVTLSELREPAQDALIRSTPEPSQNQVFSLYGLSPAHIRELLASDTFTTWSDFDLYSQTQLHVALNVPVAYHDRWLGLSAAKRTDPLRRIERQFSERASSLKFKVLYDGTELRKPTLLRATRKAFVAKRLHYEGEAVSYDGYLFAGHGGVVPKELQGVLLRIRETAVGEYSHDLLDFPAARGSLVQRWVSAEIYASDELEDAMNIDRSTLRSTHPAYVELRLSFHQFLGDFLGEVRTQLYQAASRARRQESAEIAGQTILNELQKLGTSQKYPASSLRSIAKAIEEQLADTPTSLVRKLTASEAFLVFIDAVGDTLPPKLGSQLLASVAQELFNRRGR